MPMEWISVLLLLQLSGQFSPGSCGKVLVWPTEYSHWINMKTILDALVQRGHEVTVLTSSASILVDPNKPSAIQFEVFPTSVTKDDFEDLFNRLTSKLTYTPKYTFWTYYSQIQDNIWEYFDYIQKLCKEAVLNKKLMRKLQESRFDVVLADPSGPCGELLAELLKIPFVYSLRFSFGYTIEKYSGGLPFPPSYVPIILTKLTDQMTFLESVKNTMLSVFFDLWIQDYDIHFWDQFYSEALGRPTTLCETLGKAEIWLIRTYWDFEFPRPYLPNFEFVGGLHCKPAKPLPKEIEEFVQSSGKDGIVVFSLGSIIQNLTEEKGNLIASALAQIPQKFLVIIDKIGAAVEVNMHTMTSADLLKALRTVINDPSYKENVMRLSRIHHDQPVKPLDRAVFWIEFVMRHKGAKHLRPAAHNLTWVQYHSLDVIVFLLACAASAIFLITKCCLFSCRKFGKTGKRKKRE
ncbi:PREDICTED: UDP-glucuronosyltransferase 2B17 [Myotis davidii]|uniref:UDP-glucuronosyltransferase 2B17 n=1 Tax=Myotis davidii TaxID=225400 RepID=UPI0003EC2758|nr:PREDICTED: UDP-glucuronosyltransferase 2B17 [Myotis davidii]